MVASPRAIHRRSGTLPANGSGSSAPALVLAVFLVAGTLVFSEPPVRSAPTRSLGPIVVHPAAAVRPPRRMRLVPPPIVGPAAIVIDAQSGRVFFAKDPDRPLLMASLAKVMTALLVLQNLDLSGWVVVSRAAASAPPTDVGLRPGERISVRTLLQGMLLRSGNDAAVALAQVVSGSVPSFVSLMNERARSLGLSRTRFADPAGLNDAGHASVRDLAQLARVAMSDPTFARMVDSDRLILRDGRRPPRTLWNINLFRGQYRGAVGVKTGYTSRAGQCLVAAARRGGHLLIAVVVGESAATHWQDAFGDAARLLDYGFARILAALRTRPGRSI